MPCRSDYMEPSAREEESLNVMAMLYEMDLLDSPPDIYGDTSKLDEHTRMLCDCCKHAHAKGLVSELPLELQIWWRDHQKADEIRMEKLRKKAEFERKKQRALSKLTDEERRVLGLDVFKPPRQNSTG